ncbi:putative ribonuclease H-like domain-containing protein [Tanacetum coccineum]
MAASSPVCLMSKATSTKSWLLHRRFSHLNFGTINHLTKQDLVDGLLKFKYDKDHLCFVCEYGKSKKATLSPNLVSSTHSKLELIHMDLCGPIRVESINGKKYILVIVDDYSRYTWVDFLRTKDEAPEMIKKFISQAHYENLGIMKQFSIARTPQQNGVVEIRNRTLAEAAQTMLIFSKAPEFLWDKAISTACFTQNQPKRLWKPSTLSLMKSQLWLLKQLFGPETNRFNTDDSLAEFTSRPSKEDLDNLFGPMYEEYFTKRSPEVSINFAAQTTLNNEDTPSSSLIIVEENEAPPLVSSSEEQISLISTNVAVESVQEDFVYLDRNTLITPYKFQRLDV